MNLLARMTMLRPGDVAVSVPGDRLAELRLFLLARRLRWLR
jgi:hypothetical protein